VPADKGTVEIDDTSYGLNEFSAAHARQHGLHFVHQEVTTFQDMTVAENMAIGRGFETTPVGGINWRRVRRRVNEVLGRFGISATPDQRLGELGPASQTMVAIARALQDQEGVSEGILALDEPTAALAPEEADELLSALRRYASEGQAVLFISHRLDEVLEVADQITILRDGQRVATVSRNELTRDELVDLLAGGSAEPLPHSAPDGRHQEGAVLEAEGLSGGRVRDANVRVAAGEIVGVTGPAGSGRSALLRILFGAQQRRAGAVRVNGKPYSAQEPADAIGAGLAYVPPDRRDALIGDLSLAENLTVGVVGHYWRHGFLNYRAEAAAVVDTMRKFNIRAAGPDVPIKTLSGGNQQKAVLARCLTSKPPPRLLLLDEPTQGVDVGARRELWRLVRSAAQAGTGVLVVGSDFEELKQLCDRIIVLLDGTVVAEFPVHEFTVDRLNRVLHGHAAEQ
jgi:ribose transport system ATP-binding protein